MYLAKLFLQDDNYVPVMKESTIDVKAMSNAYKEKKKMRDDSNVVKIGKTNHNPEKVTACNSTQNNSKPKPHSVTHFSAEKKCWMTE